MAAALLSLAARPGGAGGPPSAPTPPTPEEIARRFPAVVERGPRDAADSVRVARELVAQLKARNDALRAAAASPSELQARIHLAAQDLPLIQFFHLEDLERIERDGFLNQFQTRLASGFADPVGRFVREAQLLGFRFPKPDLDGVRKRPRFRGRLGAEAPEPLERPELNLADPWLYVHAKYGMLLPDERFLLRSSPLAELGLSGLAYDNFGDAAVVFDDAVKDRATWVAGDSLVASELRFPEDVHAFGEAAHGELPLRPQGIPYLEAQIWGQLTLADAREIWLPKPPSDERMARLRELGIPVYLFELRLEPSGDERGLVLYYRRGPKILEGRPAAERGGACRLPFRAVASGSRKESG